MRPRDDTPADFAKWAAIESDAALQRRFSIGWTKVQRLRAELQIPSPGRVYAHIRVPDDFATVAVNRTVREMARHYDRSRDVITAWFKRSGVERKIGKPGGDRTARARPAPKATNVAREGNRSALQPSISATRHERDMSPAGQAADYLRQFSTVYRCNASGVALAGGSHWRRGNAVLTDAELIERADALRSRRTPTGPAYSLVGNAMGMV